MQPKAIALKTSQDPITQFGHIKKTCSFAEGFGSPWPLKEDNTFRSNYSNKTEASLSEFYIHVHVSVCTSKVWSKDPPCSKQRLGSLTSFCFSPLLSHFFCRALFSVRLAPTDTYTLFMLDYLGYFLPTRIPCSFLRS